MTNTHNPVTSPHLRQRFCTTTNKKNFKKIHQNIWKPPPHPNPSDLPSPRGVPLNLDEINKIIRNIFVGFSNKKKIITAKPFPWFIPLYDVCVV